MGALFRNLTLCGLLVLSASAAVVVYSNDFDGGVVTSGSVSGTVSGGDQTGGQGNIAGGTTSVEGFAAYDEFSGDFHRVTVEDDRLIIEISGLDTTAAHSIAYSLAMLDSWDGTSSQHGSDLINMTIYDGGAVSSNMVSGGVVLTDFSVTHTSNGSSLASQSFITSTVVQNTQLGFNEDDPWWNEDGFVLNFDNLVASSGTLIFEIWASSGGVGSGFQGGDDESFAIDNFVVTSNIPEPSISLLALLSLAVFAHRRYR